VLTPREHTKKSFRTPPSSEGRKGVLRTFESKTLFPKIASPVAPRRFGPSQESDTGALGIATSQIDAMAACTCGMQCDCHSDYEPDCCWPYILNLARSSPRVPAVMVNPKRKPHVPCVWNRLTVRPAGGAAAAGAGPSPPTSKRCRAPSFAIGQSLAPWIIRTRYGPQPEAKAASSLHVKAPGGSPHG